MLLSLLAQSTDKTFWMPQRASTYAAETDWAFYLIYWICVIFTCLIGFCLVYFTIRFRHRGDNEQAAPPTESGHSTTLELTWTIIPTILVLIIFYYGFRTYLKHSVIPPDAYEINVTARMWSWAFTYPDGHVDDKLHIPANTPIRLVLASDDVIHSFFIPAFRAKRDVVPGRFNKMWFESEAPGTYQGYCAEYCGTNHSTMLFDVVVHPISQSEADLLGMASWRDWMETSRDPTALHETPADWGKHLYTARGCNQCHSVDGTPNVGPTWLNMFGSERQLSDGSKVIADEDYIVESINYPQAKIVAGFGHMPSYAGQFKTRDFEGMIAYLKSISEHHDGTTIQWTPADNEAGAESSDPSTGTAEDQASPTTASPAEQN